MIERRDIMGMPIAVDIVGADTTSGHEAVFTYFRSIDTIFSTYKPESEMSRINRGEIALADASGLMNEIFARARETKADTNGFFDIEHDGTIDPSGIVKGWAIQNAARILDDLGYEHFYVEAGGDIEVRGFNDEGKLWQIGIRNPFEKSQIIKVVALTNRGIATSGAYLRGAHIYNPHDSSDTLAEIASMTVIGPNAYEADRFATAAFAMGRDGIAFIDSIPDLEGYSIDKYGIATMTRRFIDFTYMT
jgi:thiamine biosynthesis lipoprotein